MGMISSLPFYVGIHRLSTKGQGYIMFHIICARFGVVLSRYGYIKTYLSMFYEHEGNELSIYQAGKSVDTIKMHLFMYIPNTMSSDSYIANICYWWCIWCA